MESSNNPIPATKIVAQKTVSNKFDIIKLSFNSTYVLLITTGTITLVEALATKNPEIRHIMNLETCISIIAGYFYSQFTNKVSTVNGIIDYKELTESRYNDWIITTPLMLLAFMLSLSYNNKNTIHFATYITVVLLNFGMLYSGYLGEKSKISKLLGCIIGFSFFFALFGLIYYYFVKDCINKFNYVLFGIYFIIWSLYGVVYWLDDENKNIGYNLLDLSSKCFTGLGLWAYFTKILVV